MTADEFILIVLRSSDNQMSHVVCCSKKFIFDCNLEKCLPFTKEGLDCCCGEIHHFVGIAYGYYFQKRPLR